MITPKVGDRVRVVFEDVVVEVDEDFFVTASNEVFHPGMTAVVSVEVIAPPFVLPTKRWAQVADVLGKTLYTRVENGMWRDCDGVAYFDYEMYETPGLRVISEGVDDE